MSSITSIQEAGLRAGRTTSARRRLEQDDARVIHRALSDPPAFAAIFDRHWPWVHAFCVRRAGAAGEDIAAEAFRVAFDRRRRYDRGRADARPWLIGIAVNLLREHFRSAERGRRAELRTADAGTEETAEDALGRIEAEQLGPRLAAALRSIPTADRDALLLLAWAGLGYEDIARALDVPVGTVRSRIHRARKRVRAHLEGEEPS
jgi:RNA polymerase sigma factor (sigma-70 family)